MACHLYLAGILSTRVPFLIVCFLSIALKKHFVENLGTGYEGSSTCMWSKFLSCSVQLWHGLAAGHSSSSFLAKTPNSLQGPGLLPVESWSLKSDVDISACLQWSHLTPGQRKESQMSVFQLVFRGHSSVQFLSFKVYRSFPTACLFSSSQLWAQRHWLGLSLSPAPMILVTSSLF